VFSLPDQDLLVIHLCFLDEAYTKYNPGEISQVKHVVRLSWSWKQVGYCFFVHL